jgi:hypothetical protein
MLDIQCDKVSPEEWLIPQLNKGETACNMKGNNAVVYTLTIKIRYSGGDHLVRLYLN